MIDFWLKKAVSFVWSLPVLCLFLCIHLYFTYKTGFVQKKLIYGIRLSVKTGNGQLSPFEALSIMLASALGTGNIIGMGTMIAIGGVGSVFWCWISGIFAMATKYAETYICVKYRVLKNGQYKSGAMYVLSNVCRKKRLGLAFAFFTLLASFGIGAAVQSKAIADVCEATMGLQKTPVCTILALLVGAVVFCGLSGVSVFCSFCVPAVTFVYMLCCLCLLCINFSYIPQAIGLIIKQAFNFKSAFSGIFYSGLIMSLRAGISRGLFTNEAGLGSSPITAGESDGNCRNAALCAMSTVFWDTIVMCLATALCMVTHMVKNNIGGTQIGDGTTLAFMCFGVLPFGRASVALCVAIFGFASIVGWYFLGQRGYEYIFDTKRLFIFRTIWVLCVFISPFAKADMLWMFADLLNALMMFPNLYMLIKLKNEIN